MLKWKIISFLKLNNDLIFKYFTHILPHTHEEYVLTPNCLNVLSQNMNNAKFHHIRLCRVYGVLKMLSRLLECLRRQSNIALSLLR